MLRLFLIFISLVCSCSKKEAAIPSTESASSNGPQKVDASTLKVSKVDAELVTTPKRKVTFKIRKHEDAMYAQFIICTVTKPVRCNPSDKAPGIARTDEYEFLSPPQGDLEIKVRACVESPFALNQDKPCGDWKRTTVASQALGKSKFR